LRLSELRLSRSAGVRVLRGHTEHLPKYRPTGQKIDCIGIGRALRRIRRVDFIEEGNLVDKLRRLDR